MSKQINEYGKKKYSHGTFRCKRKPHSPKCRKQKNA